MNRFTLITGITALVIMLTMGCSGDSPAPPSDVSSGSLYECRIGNTVIEPGKPNLIALGRENAITFQLLKNFHPQTFYDSVQAQISISNPTSGWNYTFRTGDIVNNGTISFENNEWGGLATFSGFHPLNYMVIPKPSGTTLISSNNVAPGDLLNVKVDFLRAEYEDATNMLLYSDSIVMYNSKEVVLRQVGSDNLDTDGFVQSIKFGNFQITDEDINIIPLHQVFDIIVDFNAQLNPYKFYDILEFRIILNNLFSGESYIIEKNALEENGEIFVTDYVRGIVKYKLNHPMDEMVLGGVSFNPSSPGDLIEVKIDLFSGEDILENEFKWQGKKFRIFHAGNSSPL